MSRDRRAVLSIAAGTIASTTTGCLRFRGNDGANNGGGSENGAGDARSTTSLNDEITVRWTKSFDIRTGSWLERYANPLVTLEGDIVAASRDGTVVRYASNGTRLWETSVDPNITRTYFQCLQRTDDSLLFIPDDESTIHAFDADTGDVLWSVRPAGANNNPTVELLEGVLVVFGREQADKTPLIAGYAPTTGDHLWTAWPQELADSEFYATGSTARIHGGRIVEDQSNGFVSVDAAGNPRREPTIESHLVDLNNPGRLMDTTTYLTKRFLYAYDGQADEMRWTYEPYDQITTPAVPAGDAVFFGSNDHGLYAIERESGEQRFRFKTDDLIRAAPVVTGDVAYVGGFDQSVYAIDVETGDAHASLSLSGEIGALAFASGTLYAVTESRLYALEPL